MKYFFLLSLVLAISPAVWSQHGEGGDTCDVWNVTVDNTTCSSGNYSSTTFNAPNCSTFYLTCSIFGASCSPAHCKVTARVYRSSDNQQMGTCQNWSEEPPVCGGSGGNWAQILLTSGVQYKLVVWFEACPDYSCTGCTNCTAQGVVTVVHP